MVSEQKLDFWLKNNLNVLLIGRRGVGKSTMILDAARRNNIKMMYFSAATMDPFTDFVGTPYKAIDPVTNHAYIDYIRPKMIENDEVEFMFFDEFNRAKPKIRNAVMELIQFKSINGKKLQNLRMIWAACNPENDESSGESYNVEVLDPAEIDRFHVITNIEYKANKEWFKQTFPEHGGIIVDWWNALPTPIKDKISPRRLEYALQMYALDNGDITDVLPKEANISQLITQLAHGSFSDRLKTLMEQNNPEETKKSLLEENFFAGAKKLILANSKYIEYFSDYLPPEKFNSLLIENELFRKIILSSQERILTHKEAINQIVEAAVAPRSILRTLKEALVDLPKDRRPRVDIINQLYNDFDEQSLSRSEYRLDATAALKEVNFTACEKEKLIKAMVINSYIAARTMGDMWTDTRIIFDRINTAALASYNLTFTDLYQNVKNDQKFKKMLMTGGDDDKIVRLESRLTKWNYLTGGSSK